MDTCDSKVCQHGNEKMKYEKFRVESFKYWPVPYINVRDLAKNGFYYIGKEDYVRCAFCKVVLTNWQAEDDPNIEHQNWAPYCPLVKDQECDNIPLKKVVFQCC